MKKLNEVFSIKEDVFGSSPGGKVDPARIKTPEEARTFLLGLSADLKSFQNSMKINRTQFPAGVDLNAELNQILNALSDAESKMGSAVAQSKNKIPAPGSKPAVTPPPLPPGV